MSSSGRSSPRAPTRPGRGALSRRSALVWALIAAFLAALSGCGGSRHGASTAASTAPKQVAFARRRRTRRPTAIESSVPPEPPIVQRPIPFGPRRKQEMVAYAERHYGIDTYKLIDPHVIVEHYTETTTFQEAYNTFWPDAPDLELHELPGTCAHFVVDRDGTIYQLVPITIMCRHTVGLNWTAIGIENVGMSDEDVMSDAAELRSSLALTRWLRCKERISIANVIGHNESLSSPYHHEDVAALRTQTHSDMQRPTMDRYRAMLARLGC